MSINQFMPSLAISLCVALLASCASKPVTQDAPGATSPAPAAAPATAPASAPANTEPAAKTETESADALEKKFQEAARGYKVVERNGKTLYCKREKVIGSTIPTMQCLTESQLRLQVENMEDMRERMRSSSKCTLSRGCSGS